MALVKWREEFCTGIAGVDYEHEQLIGQINNVYALIDDKGDRDQIVDCLGDIYGNISAHFALEERVMVKNNYDQFEAHAQDHERLLDNIQAISDEYEYTESLNEQVFKQKLNDWFQTHFKTHDARLHSLVKLADHHHSR